MSANNAKMPDWDTTMPRALALRKHIHQTIDFLRNETAHKTADRQGLSWLGMGPAKFLAANGVAHIRLVRPPAFFGTQLEQRNQAVDYDNFNAQELGCTYGTAEIISKWPLDIRQQAEDQNDSLNHRQLYEHFDHLLEQIVITQDDIYVIKKAIEKPFLRTENINAVTKNQLNNLRRLQDANHALNDEEATSFMKKAFSATAADRADFSRCFERFLMDNTIE